jgi:hypothetical protein
LAQPPDTFAAPVHVERKIRIQQTAHSRDAELATRLDALLAMDGHEVELRNGLPGIRDAERADTLLFLADPAAGADEASLIQDLCLEFKACADAALAEKAELWLLIASSRGGRALADPVATAVLSFARTLANEYPNLVVRRVSSASAVSPDIVAGTIRSIMASEQVETDYVIETEGCHVLRVEPLSDPKRPIGETGGARLERGVVGGLAGLAWTGIPRPVPAKGEVEIAVEASGLNFRDVMWAMSLLPEDILEDGSPGRHLGSNAPDVSSAWAKASPGSGRATASSRSLRLRFRLYLRARERGRDGFRKGWMRRPLQPSRSHSSPRFTHS